MKYKIKIIAIVSIFWVCAVCGQHSKQNNTDLAETPVSNLNKVEVNECQTIDFHYLILSNLKQSNTIRKIDIFLDQNSYTEENLKKLFDYISSKNPEPSSLIIIVNTDWKQLPFPSDCPPSGFSGEILEEKAVSASPLAFHFAKFYRVGKNAYFYYNPVLKSIDVKTVVMKGKAPDRKLFQ